MGFDHKSLRQQLSTTDRIVTPQLTQWIMRYGDDALPPLVADRIRELLTTKPRNRVASFSSSSAGTCARAQVYSYLGLPAVQPDAQTLNIFMDGKWRHLRWQAMMLAAGIIIDPSHVEFPLKWLNNRTMGSTDGYALVPRNHPRNVWRDMEYGVEVKGVSTFQFQRYHADNSFKPGHLEQVARYFILSDWPLFSVIYEDKTTQAIMERVIEADSPVMRPLIEQQHRELELLNEYVDDHVIPDRIAPCRMLKGPEFRDCPFGKDRTGTCANVTIWPSQARKKVTRAQTPTTRNRPAAGRTGP